LHDFLLSFVKYTIAPFFSNSNFSSLIYPPGAGSSKKFFVLSGRKIMKKEHLFPDAPLFLKLDLN